MKLVIMYGIIKKSLTYAGVCFIIINGGERGVYTLSKSVDNRYRQSAGFFLYVRRR